MELEHERMCQGRDIATRVNDVPVTLPTFPSALPILGRKKSAVAMLGYLRNASLPSLNSVLHVPLIEDSEFSTHQRGGLQVYVVLRDRLSGQLQSASLKHVRRTLGTKVATPREDCFQCQYHESLSMC
jgi:hypothetical protein